MSGWRALISYIKMISLCQKFFQWLDQTGPVSTTQQQHCKSQSTTALDCRRTKLGDGDSIMTYCQGHRLSLYCQCLFVIRAEDRFHKQGNHVSSNLNIVCRTILLTGTFMGAVIITNTTQFTYIRI